jgi:hypothetical protein
MALLFHPFVSMLIPREHESTRMRLQKWKSEKGIIMIE